MNDHGEQLREAFEAHEKQTPDPAVVYARVQELAGRYKRRRWGAQAAGGAVLGAGLIAGGIALPGVLPAGPADSGGMVAPAATAMPVPYGSAIPAAPQPSGGPLYEAPQPSGSAEAMLAAQYDAFFNAGYDYDDALRLAELWKKPRNTIGEIKAEAGRRLLAGESLPVKPDPPVETAEETAELNAFFNAGYDYDDAIQLAQLWKLGTPFEAKVEAGKRLLAREKLPIAPDPDNVAEVQEVRKVEAFFAKGYDYDDAVVLARMWKLDEPSQAKVAGGAKLLAGETLPIRP